MFSYRTRRGLALGFVVGATIVMLLAGIATLL